MASSKLADNLERGMFYENYHTRGLSMYWTEEVPDEGLEVKVQTYTSVEELEAAMRKVQPDFRQWKLNPIKGSDASVGGMGW